MKENLCIFTLIAPGHEIVGLLKKCYTKLWMLRSHPLSHFDGANLHFTQGLKRSDAVLVIQSKCNISTWTPSLLPTTTPLKQVDTKLCLESTCIINTKIHQFLWHCVLIAINIDPKCNFLKKHIVFSIQRQCRHGARRDRKALPRINGSLNYFLWSYTPNLNVSKIKKPSFGSFPI